MNLVTAMKTMSSSFNGARFAAERIAEAVHLGVPNPEAVKHVDFLKGTVEIFKGSLAESGLDQSYSRDVALIEYPLDELRNFFLNEPGTLTNVTGAYIFARFVNEHIQALQSLAEEIDADNAA